MKDFQNLTAPPVPSNFRGKNKVKVQLWYLCWFWIFRISPHALNGLRIYLLKLFGANLPYSVKIRPSAFISYPWNFSCDDFCFIGDRVFIDSLETVAIGAHVSISNDVYITSGTHRYNSASFDLTLAPVVVEDQVWLAVRSVLLPGARVSRGAIVGANSLVKGHIPSGEIWAGSPAKFVKHRPTDS